jgi:Fe2+ or Zn2+ uptake regulation protein
MRFRSRKTRQKEFLRKQVKRMPFFFTAGQLLSGKSGAGIATVYRFLNEEVRAGELHKYSCGKQALYARDKKSHCHFTCEKCGKREHFGLPDASFLNAPFQGRACHFQVDVCGVCEKCLKPKKGAREATPAETRKPRKPTTATAEAI